MEPAASGTLRRRLVTLDATLEDLAPGPAARNVDEAVSGHFPAAAELVGTFER